MIRKKKRRTEIVTVIINKRGKRDDTIHNKSTFATSLKYHRLSSCIHTKRKTKSRSRSGTVKRTDFVFSFSFFFFW